MRAFIFFNLLLLLSACGIGGHLQNKENASHTSGENSTGQTTDNVPDKMNILITISHYYPYCGGAYPDESDLNNYQFTTNTDFHLINLETGKKQLVRTNAEGIMRLNLPVGKYGLKETFKDCPLETFMESTKYPQGSDYTLRDPECYKTWWMSNFIEFTVTDPDSVIRLNHTFYDECFTGNNPCIEYTGPYPP